MYLEFKFSKVLEYQNDILTRHCALSIAMILEGTERDDPLNQTPMTVFT